MGRKPWDRAWRRADKARERNAARKEMEAELVPFEEVVANLGLTQDEIDGADDDA